MLGPNWKLITNIDSKLDYRITFTKRGTSSKRFPLKRAAPIHTQIKISATI